MDDIAVVGIGLRFPGNATSPEELWKVLERGESQWSEFPKDRLNIDGYYHPGGDRQGSISFRGGHFIKSDYTSFDAPFFSVATEDAKAIDPQQRILLEASYEALENAGIRKEDIDGSDTAVYVGSFVKDYEQICLRDPDWQPQYAATGNGTAIMSNRISYFFNLHGPSMTIDTGCSGSLVSIHLAAQSLRSGESSLAIAAGAGMILTPNTIMPMTALNFLSPDGKCFTFDARANGYGRGEGIGVVILKRMSDAIRDNDTIRAVIRGSKVNQDGHTTGITLPSKEAQVANIRSVYKSTGLDFNQTAYVECHGTGTQAGDWRELKAISESLGSSRSVDNPIIVGSVKPNIGHLEGAAGVAGLIKGVLILEHAKIPPNINFQKGNPDIDFQEWKVKVPQNMLEWPLSGLRRVSVNCFGFGGTNAHVILDEAPGYMAERSLKGNHNSVKIISPHKSHLLETPTTVPLLFLFSSHEKAGVQRVMESHVPYLKSKQDDSAVSTRFLRDYSYTLGARRSNLEWKHAIVAKSIGELLSEIELSSEHGFNRTTKVTQPKICFLFSGQGAQFAQMGKNLLSFSVFRRCLTSASQYMKDVLGSPFDLLDEILKDPKESRISDPEISQPATTALQVALVTLFRSFSITPNVTIGHSSGEIAAAVAFGAISRETAWEVAYFRGLAASTIRQKGGCEGAMIAAGLSSTGAEDFVKQCALPVEIACINSPRSVTLSCTAEVADSVLSDLSQQKIFCRRLPVSVAYHSSHMKLVTEDYNNAIFHITTHNSLQNTTMFSSVTGAPVDSADLGGHYWVNNMVSPVQYMSAVKQMMSLPAELRPDIVIELSPRAALKTLTLDIFSDIGLSQPPSYYAVIEQNRGAASCLEIVGALWKRGCVINMEKVVSPISSQFPIKCLTDIPPYPWNHTKSYWHESHLGRANRFREFPRQDLIGAPTADAISFEPRWRGFFRISENPWLQDHQVQKTIIYPAAGMVAMALQGATQLTKDKTNLMGYEITNMRIDKAMVIPITAHGLEMAMNFKQKSQAGHSFEFTIYSKPLDGAWEQHATGSIQAQYKHRGLIASFSQHGTLFKSLKETCNVPVIPRQLYELLDIVGMNYGTTFQNISQVSKGENACVSKVRIPDTKSKMPAKFEYPHLIHPATLDSMFQTPFAINNEPMVPTFISSLFVSAEVSTEIGKEFTGYATASRVGTRSANANIAMTQSTWDQPSVIIDGLQFTRLSGPSPGTHGFLPNHHNLCTEIVWEEDVAFAEFKTVEETIRLMAHKYPGLSILQIGGSSLVAEHVLRELVSTGSQAPRLARYTIARDGNDHVSSEVLSHFKGTALESFVEVRPVDGPAPLPDYHLVFLCNDNYNGSHFLKHLRTDGILFQQDHSKGDEIDFRIGGKIGAEQPHTTSDVILLLPNNPNSVAKSLSTNLTNRTQQVLFPSKIMSEGQVLENIERIKGKVVISLLDFANEPNCFPFLYDCTKTRFDTFHALQESAKGIIWITNSAHRKPLNPKGTPMIGLARTLMSEDPLKVIVTFDLEAGTDPSSHLLSNAIVSVMLKTFLPNKGSTPRELEYAEARGKVYIPRLVPINILNKLIEEGNYPDTITQPFHQNNHCTKLQISQDGLSEHRLLYVTAFSPSPKPDEVEIIFESVTINHIDLEAAMGHSADSDIGHDFIGRVERIGDNVSGFESGDYVAALVSGGAIQSRRNVDAKFVRKQSSILPLSQSISAAHCLCKLGRLGRGKAVLIHAGASSHGLCAVQVASRLGAEVFVTIMGPNLAKQRALLEGSGIKSNHILEADADDFIRAVKTATGGKDLDMVYNSTQQHIEANFSCVRKSGLILQFESKSPCPPSFRLPSKPVSVINFDFAQLLKDDPEYVVELLDETLEILKKPGWDVTADFFVSRNNLTSIQEAFSFVQETPYLGVVSINGGPQSDSKVKVAITKPTRSLSDAIFKDRTYLLAGGLGGLGRSICELIISSNARHIAFLSRSGSSGKGSMQYITELRNRGVDARVFQVDICDASALENTVLQIQKEMPPVVGVFQCAAVIKDAVFDNMNHSDWLTAMKPKTIGSDNLASIIPRVNQDDPFFIFLSSSAGVIGSRGQANYASGNCFEDALALKNRILGKRAVSIDLGPVLDAGMLADDEETLDKLRASGFYGIRHQDFLTIVSHAITMEIEPSITMPPQVILGVGTGGLIRQNNPADPYWSRTALYSYLNLVDMPPPDLSDINGSQKVDMKSMLTYCADLDAATEIVCTGLSHMLAKAMNMLPEEIDTGKPPNVYGVDSLVAVGVRNWVVSNCGVVISVFEVLSDKTVAELAAEIAQKGRFGLGHD